MATGAKKPGAGRIRSAAFRRVRPDGPPDLAEATVAVIADLIDDRGEARGPDLALRLGLSSATLVKTLKRLEEAGLVTQEANRSVLLTGEGWKMAEDARRRLKLVERFLLALGVSEETARIDSRKIEHHASEETLRAMARFLVRR